MLVESQRFLGQVLLQLVAGEGRFPGLAAVVFLVAFVLSLEHLLRLHRTTGPRSIETLVDISAMEVDLTTFCARKLRGFVLHFQHLVANLLWC